MAQPHRTDCEPPRPNETSPEPIGEALAKAPAAASDVASMAAYIADMSSELASLAGQSQMPMLAYFLNLARVEAESRSRELGGYEIQRRA